MFLRVLELEEGGEPLVLQQGDVAFLLHHGAQAGIAEQIQQAVGVGDAAVGELDLVEADAGGLIQRAAEGHQAGQVGLGRVFQGVYAFQPGGELAGAYGILGAGEEG